MSCCITDCVKAKCLAAPVYCIEDDYSPEAQELKIGVLELNTDYTIYFEDQGSGVVKKVNLTSDANGFVSFDMNDYPRFFHENTLYKVWVTLRDAGLSETEDITFNSYDIYPCVLIEFLKVSEDSETLAGIASQTVSI